jgi:hypothetical protein
LEKSLKEGQNYQKIGKNKWGKVEKNFFLLESASILGIARKRGGIG